MKKIYFLLLTFLISTTAFAQVINEIDPDTPGTDMAEFIELKWTPNTALDGLVVVLYNGSSDTSYAAFDLDGKTTDANGFFIIGNTGIINAATDSDLGASNALQNGADAVALYTGSDTDFPNATVATSTNILSAIVYDSDDADDVALLAALGETVQYNERENSAQDTESIQRNADGTYTTKAITFRQENDAATCDLSITSSSSLCDAVTTGIDNYTASFNYVGGATSTYTLTPSSGTIGGDNPDTVAMGIITILGVAEGTDVTLTITDAGGLCNIMSTVTTPVCVPSLNLPILEDFTYTDGSLTSNPNWTGFSGTDGDLLVSSGQAVVQHGTPSEDASIAFTSVPGDIYYALDLSITDPGGVITGGDYEYFAILKDDGFAFRARLDVTEATNGGDFSVGLSSSTSTATAVWPTDLSYGTTYRVTVRYNQTDGASQLWVDAASSTDASISSTGDVTTITQFALRQSDSSLNEAVFVDNLYITTTFNETLSTDDFTANTEFNLFPNPTNTGFVNITTTSNEAINVTVFDILGKQVISQTINNNSLSVSNLNAGVYILKLNQNGATTTKKLVIK